MRGTRGRRGAVLRATMSSAASVRRCGTMPYAFSRGVALMLSPRPPTIAFRLALRQFMRHGALFQPSVYAAWNVYLFPRRRVRCVVAKVGGGRCRQAFIRPRLLRVGFSSTRPRRAMFQYRLQKVARRRLFRYAREAKYAVIVDSDASEASYAFVGGARGEGGAMRYTRRGVAER